MPALLILYVILLCTTNYMYYPPKYNTFFPWIKFATSLGFIAIAVYSAFLSRQYLILYRMLPAFIFAALGDLLLGLAHSKHDYQCREFLMGTCSFLAAHVLFYAALTSIDGVHLLDFVLPFAVTGIVFILSRSKNVDLGKMQIPGVIYSFFVGLLFSKGLMIFINSGAAVPNLLILAGSFLFLVSDMILLFLNFHAAPPKWFAYANLSTYYVGIGLLGLSLYFLG